MGSQVLNRATNEVAADFANLDSGTYRLVANLYSGADGTGTLLSSVDTRLEVCRLSSFRTQTGGTPANLVVGPAGATLTTTGSVQFSAYAAATDGDALFVPSGGIAWSVLGGIGSVNADGLFVASTAGNGTVRAQYGVAGLTTGVPVTVNTFTPTRSKWTILVFLNAANDLFAFSSLNMNQMERVAGNNEVRFVVQWKQAKSLFPTSTFDGTRRYLVRPDTTNTINSQLIQDLGQSIDMGDPTALNTFVQWGRQNYPADRYGLIVWNHGNGWQRSKDDRGRAVSYDDQTGNAIQTWELKQALNGQTFDFIAWDASLMQMMEVAYEVRAHADFIVGSEESPPGEGYPYDTVFGPLRDNPDQTTRQFTKNFVDGMLGVPGYASRKITQSVLETARLGALATSIDGLAAALIADRVAMSSIVQSVRSSAQSYSPTITRNYRDLDHLCQLLLANVGTTAGVRTAATDVRAKIADAMVWEGNNANSPNSNGVAIDFSSSSGFAPLATDYARMEFADDTRWDNWLVVAP